MTSLVLIQLVGAGVCAGLIGYLAGLASLVSYPALLAVGLPPVTANVTNTVALLGAGIGTTVKSGREFVARGRRTSGQEVLIAFAGGLTGGALLVTTGETSFSSVVPWLVLAAGLLLLISPRLKSMRGFAHVPRWGYLVALFLVCIYGGYFGAGAGVIYLVVAVLASDMPFHVSVMVKSILLAASNLAATLFFVATTPINWPAALVMGAGCLAGGYLGPIVQRFIPNTVLRWAVSIAAIILAGWLWLNR